MQKSNLPIKLQQEASGPTQVVLGHFQRCAFFVPNPARVRSDQSEDASAQGALSLRIPQIEIQRQSRDVQVGRVGRGAVLAQIMGLDHKETFVRPLKTGGVLFFVPRVRCSVVEDFGRCVR